MRPYYIHFWETDTVQLAQLRNNRGGWYSAPRLYSANEEGLSLKGNENWPFKPLAGEGLDHGTGFLAGRRKLTKVRASRCEQR
jgi:hypothetical protein